MQKVRGEERPTMNKTMGTSELRNGDLSSGKREGIIETELTQ